MWSLLNPDAFLTFGSRETVSPGECNQRTQRFPKCRALFRATYIDPSPAIEVWFQHWRNKHFVSPSEMDTKGDASLGFLPTCQGVPERLLTEADGGPSYC